MAFIHHLVFLSPSSSPLFSKFIPLFFYLIIFTVTHYPVLFFSDRINFCPPSSCVPHLLPLIRSFCLTSSHEHSLSILSLQSSYRHSSTLAPTPPPTSQAYSLWSIFSNGLVILFFSASHSLTHEFLLNLPPLVFSPDFLVPLDRTRNVP